MGKIVRKWPWHIPVEFVEPGIDPEEVRRRRAMNPPRVRSFSVFSLWPVLALVLVIFAAWWVYGRDDVQEAQAQAERRKPATTATATATVTATATPQPTLPGGFVIPVMLSPTVTVTVTVTPTATLTPTPRLARAVAGLFHSPVRTPTPTPTPTPSPFDYEVLYFETRPESLYSYVSGWVLEKDGKTPRPVAVELVFPTGVMRYPRPNNRDIATGRYEFMVTPGDYVLRVAGGDVPPIPIHVGESGTPVRYEITLRYLHNDRQLKPARSNPWVGAPPTPQGGAPTPTPSPSPTAMAGGRHKVFLPLVLRNVGSYKVFLPVALK